MYAYQSWGLTVLPAGLQMALEEHALQLARKGQAVVRTFSTPQDAVVLGYAQAPDVVQGGWGSQAMHSVHHAGVASAPPLDLVRRPTGGSHVQIGPNTLAYSVAVPRDGSFRTYEDFRRYYGDALVRALGDLGIQAAADHAASTVNVAGRVVASHAVLWGTEAALLHGLLVLSPYDVDLLARRVLLQTRAIRGQPCSEAAAIRRIPALSLLLRRDSALLREAVSQAILRAFSRDGSLASAPLAPRDLRQADLLRRQKHGHPAWIRGRAPPFSPEGVEAIPGEELAGPLKAGLGYCFYSQVRDQDFRRMVE
ncbi:MAG: lipoate--protein ligase family protein [Candidatus Aenigmarchaeota archaeon]|nr:lipoate--protein ligase family protein [Candidatus Aenigmarchaeota archaeon]